MARKRMYDDSWHQPEMQWLEDGINIWIQEVVGFVCNLFALACLIVRVMWTIGIWAVRKLNLV